MVTKHTSPLVYVLVWLGLSALTLLSFLLSRAHLGSADTVIALVIAVIKSTLVGLFFMHLLEQHLRTAFVPIVTTGFIVLLISLVVTDVATRHTFPKAPVRVVLPEGIGPPSTASSGGLER